MTRLAPYYSRLPRPLRWAARTLTALLILALALALFVT
jgi:hypothetical protein